MANRKGVTPVNKWQCSDGKEFTTANEANDYQGALNEIESFFPGFESWIKTNTIITVETVQPIIFAWEFHKNSKGSRSLELFPSTEAGVTEPSIAIENQEADPADQEAGTDQADEKAQIKKDTKL